MKKKLLSNIANSFVERCTQILGTSIDALVEEFEQGFEPQVSNYSRKLVEFCSSKALSNVFQHIDEMIANVTFTRLTFDMMLSWENPSPENEKTFSESVAKEKEDEKVPQMGGGDEDDDDIPLFYSDLMPLLVGDEQTVGEEAFVWLGSLVPLAADVVNARFAFEELTATTANRLHFPAYDRFSKEIQACIKYLQKQTPPNGMELADDEFILHVDGTAKTQSVVRHIGATSWPGRLTLTNYALYFEVSNAITYDNALKIDLSNKDVVHKVSPVSTGPWGAPLFDKAMIYESSLLPDGLVLEFPEMTSSTRRDLWLALTKEVILLHQFLSKMNIESPLQSWEMHARTILGILRLHAARELLKLAPPVPNNFLIFALFDELPKGDYVLEELCSGLKKMNTLHPCSATSILKGLNMSHPIVSNMEVKKGFEEPFEAKEEVLTSLETTIEQVREEAKEVSIAEASVEGLKEEGISETVAVLMELLSPLKHVAPWFEGILAWERPKDTIAILSMFMIIIYKDWVGYAIAALLLCGVGTMLWARQVRLRESYTEIVVDTSSDQSTIDSIISAQHGMNKFREIIQATNIAILKMWSILVSKAPKQSNQVMLIMVGTGLFLFMVPLKYIIMAATLHLFTMNTQFRKSRGNEQGERRMREWWNSILVIPIRIKKKTA